MGRNILIVDDDKIWLRLIQKKFEKFSDTFSPLVAGDGLEAIEKLKRHSVSLVVTDMQMPNMDGLALLAHLSAHFPEIPVIVVTAYSTPKLKKAVLERGGAGYIEKPFMVEDLAEKIKRILQKESEGGILQTVPLEMFIQLIEMEQKTCTIRVVNKSTTRTGVLFFRDGELLDARVPGLQGKNAAYEIFSWDGVSMAIQDTCKVTEKRIEEDLQAILLDAMRLKDEAADAEQDAAPPPPASDNVGDPIDTGAEELMFADDTRQGVTWEKSVAAEKGILSIATDRSWAPLLEKAAALGQSLKAGRLQACYVSRGGDTDWIVVPGDACRVISVDPSCARDKIIRILKAFGT